MKTQNGDLAAMPVIDESRQEQYNGVLNTRYSVASYGLTKRELFAAMAMQGLLSSLTNDDDLTSAQLAKASLSNADALLAALDGEK